MIPTSGDTRVMYQAFGQAVPLRAAGADALGKKSVSCLGDQWLAEPEAGSTGRMEGYAPSGLISPC